MPKKTKTLTQRRSNTAKPRVITQFTGAGSIEPALVSAMQQRAISAGTDCCYAAIKVNKDGLTEGLVIDPDREVVKKLLMPTDSEISKKQEESKDRQWKRFTQFCKEILGHIIEKIHGI